MHRPQQACARRQQRQPNMVNKHPQQAVILLPTQVPMLSSLRIST
jgi:hypothetical protein